LNQFFRAQDISAVYIKREVLKNVSIEISKNEIVALIGPNGAGKSTLLKVISGILKPSSGRLFYKGIDITHKGIYERITMGIGYFMQGGEVFKSMTVEENLRLASSEIKHRNNVIKFSENDIYSIFPNLKGKQQILASFLSGGEKQALALGMVLITDPDLLLLDEPSAGLAPIFVKDILEKIKMINEKWGITVLIIEQNAGEALRIADRTYVMKLGRIYKEGRPEEIIQEKVLEKAFLE
jgi:branched-chain amino acid transport system ATP-binding protein